jgi:hypothetical protein
VTIQRLSRLPVGTVEEAEGTGAAEAAAEVAAVTGREVHGRPHAMSSVTRRSKRDATGGRGSLELRVAGPVTHNRTVQLPESYVGTLHCALHVQGVIFRHSFPCLPRTCGR